jgi:phosphomannomutase
VANCFTPSLASSQAIGGNLCFNREVNQRSTKKITYTAMHGVGHAFIKRSFEAFGLKPFCSVPEQEKVGS